MNEETTQLIERVIPLLDAIDLEIDFPTELQGAINSACVSGGEVSNLGIKAMVLSRRGDITHDELITLLLNHSEIEARLKNPDKGSTWMPLDEIDFPYLGPVVSERLQENANSKQRRYRYRARTDQD